MKLKSLVAALAVAVSGGAFAADVNHVIASPLGDGDSFTSADTVSSGAFVTYSFTLAGLSNLDGLFSSFVNSKGVYAALSGYPTLTFGSTTLFDNYSSSGEFHFSDLAAGDYVLSFGTNNIGGWSKNATFVTYGEVTAVSAVPEPETYAMILAGLGIVGFMSRRRKAS